MRCSSHTTVRSASLPTSRGRVARRAKPMPPYSALVRSRTVRLYEDGLSCRAVAELVKVDGRASPHYVTILRWAREAGKGRCDSFDGVRRKQKDDPMSSTPEQTEIRVHFKLGKA